MTEHKHWLSGRVRVHNIKIVHKDKQALTHHKKALGHSLVKKLVKSRPQLKVPQQLSHCSLPIDNDGYIMVDLTTLSNDTIKNTKGVRVKFVSVRGRNRRTVGVQFEKE